MDIRLMTNVLELVTVSEERIVEEENGRFEKGAYASACNGNIGCIHRLIRNCHLLELFSFPSHQTQMHHLKEEM